MTRVTCHMSMSLDGFVAGPDQSLEAGLGVGGIEVHRWHLPPNPTHEADVAAAAELLRPMGAYLMGRNMFSPTRGPWTDDWRGWWGDEPPYHAPVFILTNHEREPVEMAGGTTFHFITEGFDAALARAREVAGDMDVDIAGGASTVRQAFAAGAIDDLYLDIAPVLLGRGESMFDGIPLVALTQQSVTYSPDEIHVHYTVG
ncbi:MAG TPA: dihydrofolate reductase family protein [Mycobacteriales bacterium]|nr:dihydrofolate reductase family protein [Mycobacteriales bacterium]